MCPFAHTNRHDFRGLVDELVPGVACRIDDVFVTVEDAVRQVGLAQVLPDVFGRVRLRRSGRQEQRRDVVGELQCGGGVPAGAASLRFSHHKPPQSPEGGAPDWDLSLCAPRPALGPRHSPFATGSSPTSNPPFKAGFL